jgi:hypothetical protein
MNVGIAPYVAVEDIAWLERQLAARRNINIQLGDVKMIRAESARWEKAEQAGVKLLTAPVDARTEKTDAYDIEDWNLMQEDGERMARQDEDHRAQTEEE